MTGIEVGFETGGRTTISLPIGGGLITPSDFPSLSLSVPVETVLPGSCGAIFSAGTVFGSGMFGSRGRPAMRN